MSVPVFDRLPSSWLTASHSKFALEGVSQALAKELDPSWGIKITLLEIGAFNTSIISEQENLHVMPVHPAYTSADLTSVAVRDYIASGKATENGGDASKAAREIYSLAFDDSVGLRVPLGLDAIADVSGQVDESRRDVDAAGRWSMDLK